MKPINSRRIVCSAVLVCALCAALAVASTAVAALPSDFVLQQQFANSDLMLSPNFVDASHGWAVGYPNNHLYRTTDGATWQVSTPAAWTGQVYAVAFGTQSAGWAFGDSGEIFATIDGGVTWVPQTSPTSEQFDGGWATDANHAWAYTYDGTIVGTVNGGANWAVQRNVPGQRLYHAALVDATHAYIVGFQTGSPSVAGPLVLKTTDGASWTQQTAFPPSSAELRSVWFIDQLHGWTASIDPSQVFETTDGGANWNLRASNLYPTYPTADPWQSLVFVSPTHGFLGITGLGGNVTCLWETTNGGSTWTAFEPNGTGLAKISGMTASGTGHVWAMGSLGSAASIWAWTGSATPPATPPATPVTAASTKLGAPVIRPQFKKHPFTVEDGRWLKASGSISPKHTPGKYPITVKLEKRVGKRWLVKRTFEATLSRSGWTYSAWVRFPSSGRWRIRAVHEGKHCVKSGYTYYKVIDAD